MTAVDPSVIAGRVAINVHRPADDPDVLTAVNAAIIYVQTYTGLAELDPAGVVPDDPLTVIGLIGLGARMYLDQFAPNGATVAVGDSTFDPIYTPEDPYRHYHHFFDRLTVGAPGVA